jgi:hypothetical protein
VFNKSYHARAKRGAMVSTGEVLEEWVSAPPNRRRRKRSANQQGGLQLELFAPESVAPRKRPCRLRSSGPSDNSIQPRPPLEGRLHLESLCTIFGGKDSRVSVRLNEMNSAPMNSGGVGLLFQERLRLVGKANLHPFPFYTIKVTSPTMAANDCLVVPKSSCPLRAATYWFCSMGPELIRCNKTTWFSHTPHDARFCDAPQ